MENNQKSLFETLSNEVNRGLAGDNTGIPIGFKSLDRYISVRKRIYTLVFGASGSGKSTLVQNAYILNPFDWWWKNKNTTKIKLKIVYFSMERSKTYVTAKWLCRKIFLNEGVYIPLPKLMGWWDTKLSKDEHDLFLMYKPYFDNMETVVEVIDGVKSPKQVLEWMVEWGDKNGKIEKISEFEDVYIPNDENLITIVIGDHQSLIKRESGQTKKDAIDKLSGHYQFGRDFYGFSPVLVAQMNRELGNIGWQKMESFEPMPEQIKDSGTSYEDKLMKYKLHCPL